MEIKYCVKPQTVLTVQKENAFFAASISTSATVHCVTSLDCSGFPVFPSCLSKPNLSADGQTKATGQRHHLPLKVLLEVEKQWCCSERQHAGGGHCSPHRWLSGEPQQEPGAHCPGWAKAKSDATALQRQRPPWRPASQGNSIIYTLLVLTWGLQKQSAGRKQEECATLRVTAQGHLPHAACGSSPARSTQSLLRL